MKIRVLNPVLRDLFDQLRFAPVEQKKKQLAAADQLLMILNADRDYPYDFVVYRITGYRPRVEPSQPLLSGKVLIADLRVWIAELSDELELNVSDQKERIYAIEQLAIRFNVSCKTVRRWQKRGLNGRIYVFEDGKKRLGFKQSAVETFEASNLGLIQKAESFRTVDELQRQKIISLAEELAAKKKYRTQFALVRDVAKEINRSCLTIRSILDKQALKKERPDSLPRSRGRLTAKEAAALHKLNQQGTTIKELVEKFKRTRSSIHRIINQQRARELFARKIDYIQSPEFSRPDADELILHTEITDAKDSHLLSRRQEMCLFRRYNYLKYLAVGQLKTLNKDRPQSALLSQIISLLHQADEVKTRIIESNMPLVINIAGKHTSSGHTMSELVSEGNMSLMAAVEKFDYTRGYRFSTYASWAIVKEFARLIPAEARRKDRAGGADMTNLPVNLRIEQMPDISAIEQAQRDLLIVIENNLDEREQYVILNHYALDSNVIKKKPMTLMQIGEHLKLSKEAIRQIELKALQKLRQSLSPEQFDLLMG